MKNFEQFEMSSNEVNKVEGGYLFNFYSYLSSPTSYSSVQMSASGSSGSTVSYSYYLSNGIRTISGNRTFWW